MTSVLRRILPDSSIKNEDHYDDYSMEYSFAIEYSGPPVSHDIPQVAPVDVSRIPTASAAARAAIFGNLHLPVIQPIIKTVKKFSDEPEVGKPGIFGSGVGEVRSFDWVYRRNSSVGSERDGKVVVVNAGVNESNVFNGATHLSAPDILGWSSRHNDLNQRSGSSDVDNDLNQLSGSSDVDELDGDCKAGVNPTNFDSVKSISRSQEISSEISSTEGEVNGSGEDYDQRCKTSTVTFRNLPSDDAGSGDSDLGDDDIFPEKSVVSDDGKKGLCCRCHKRIRFSDKESCFVCGSKYCSKCVLRAMGSMPEGRKCITCIGYRIDESKRGSLGKCSRMLKRLFSDDIIKQIMRSELSCQANQLPPHLVCVNDHLLSSRELVLLQSSPDPPKNLRPGKYWYDKVSGLWGVEGKKPCQIITSQLAVGGQIKQGASNGNTNVLINSREITKAEIWMLKAADIHYEGYTHFWLTPDGSCLLEGMNNVVGNLWGKRRVKIVCAALSLPFRSDCSKPGDEDDTCETDRAISKSQEHKHSNKFLLVGCDESGMSTIFKQAKIVYQVPFSEDEKQDVKFVIQRNLYKYIGILLEGHEHFEEEYLFGVREQLAKEPGPSEISDQINARNIYSLSPRLKAFASWLLKVMMAGNLEAIFPAATREFSPSVEELWKDKAFQETYKRSNELHMLPRVASYFLDRAVEISQVDYEPSEMDILYAEGITSSNGIASMEFSFPNSSQDEFMEATDQKDSQISYQLIRVHASSLGQNCKWLDMFEDVDLVLYCVSLTDYAEYCEDINGISKNKMLETKKHFENFVTHPTLAGKDFLLILNKSDLLEETIKHVPLTQCHWFKDFNPVFSTNSSYNPPLAHQAFHYIAVQFKRLFHSLTGKKLFVSKTTGLEADSVDKALRYGKEILRWGHDRKSDTLSINEWSTESTELSTSA